MQIHNNNVHWKTVRNIQNNFKKEHILVPRATLVTLAQWARVTSVALWTRMKRTSIYRVAVAIFNKTWLSFSLGLNWAARENAFLKKMVVCGELDAINFWALNFDHSECKWSYSYLTMSTIKEWPLLNIWENSLLLKVLSGIPCK